MGRRLLALWGLLFAIMTAEAVPTAVCQRAEGTIVVDGRLEESTWRKAAPLSPLRDLSGGAAAYSADIRMAYDDEFLYIGAVLPAKTLRASQTKRDSIIYHDDDFEVFIDPTGTGRNYLELEINALGTVWDLFLTAPYRAGAACVALHDWDIKGLRSAVTLQGTLNAGEGDDTSWTVELAWPWASITGLSELPRKGRPPAPGTEIRMNFSRVDHPSGAPFGTPGYAEVNSVWAPTRQATIHAPEHWGRVRLSERPVGTPETFPPTVGLWVHGGDKALSEKAVRAWADAGVTTLIIDGSPEQIARAARWGKACGLRTVAWFWSLNRPGDAEALRHPEWYAMSAEGKRCHAEAERPFVAYYQFLCPSHPEVVAHLKAKLAEVARLPEVDAVQLDYIRLPDVVLPKALWKTYGLDMSRTLPPYDFCYCPRCRAAYGAAPKAEDPAWAEFRLKQVAAVADALADTARAMGKPCGAAVFPTPRLAAGMVRQDWGRFRLDFAFPMDYASFYEEKEDWILGRVAEARETVGARFPIYPGLHLPDFTPEALRAFLPRLLRANPEGFCLFSHDTFSPAHQAALENALGQGTGGEATAK